MLYYYIDDSTRHLYLHIHFTKAELKLEFKSDVEIKGLVLTPNEWNLLEIDVFEDPVDHFLKAEINLKAAETWITDRSEETVILQLSDPQMNFELNPKSSHYATKRFDLEFYGQHWERCWIKDLTFIGFHLPT